MSKPSVKAHVATSTIPDSGQGLFATVPITKGSVIAEFKGKLLKPDQQIGSNRSLIRFADDWYLECNSTDLASFANDPVQFMPNGRRKLYKSLEADQSFYHIHPVAKINSKIKLNEQRHRAFLVATTDIKPLEEIFCHYGFQYWFMKEFCSGFLFETKMNTDGFPKQIHNYPAFKLYVATFYPGSSEYTATEYESGETDIIISYPQTAYQTVLRLGDYAGMMRKAVLKN